MILKSTTMLYYTNTAEAMVFWTEKMGFILTQTEDYGDVTSYEIASNANRDIIFGIHDKNWVAQANPGMNVGFPSLLFETDDLEAERERLLAVGVEATPIMEHQGMIHFAFPDCEGNYMAITKK